MAYLHSKMWSDKARAAALAKRRGESPPADTPQQSQTAEQAVAHANQLIASGILNKGKKGKAGGKGKAGAKAPKAKDPAIAKEHAQRLAEHEADRAQRQKEHAQAQTEHAQSRAEHEADRQTRLKEHAQQMADRQKAQADKAKAAKEKAKAGKGKGGSSDAARAKVIDRQQAKDDKAAAQTALGAAASAMATGGDLKPAQVQQLVSEGMAHVTADGVMLTPAGHSAARRHARTTKAIGSIEQQRAMFASMSGSGKLQKRGPNGKRTPQATAAAHHTGGSSTAPVIAHTLPSHPSADPTSHITIVQDARPQGQRPRLVAPVSGDMAAHARFRQQKQDVAADRQTVRDKAKANIAKIDAITKEINNRRTSTARLRELQQQLSDIRAGKSIEDAMQIKVNRRNNATDAAYHQTVHDGAVERGAVCVGMKAAARYSGGDLAHVQGMHDSSVALGAECAPVTKAAPEDMSADPAAALPVPDEEAGEGEDDEEEEDTGHTGLMIALQVPPDVASELAIDGDVAPEDMHVTLAFLGDAADFQKQQFAILASVEKVLADAQPLQATIGGVGRFATAEDDGTNAFYASVDCPELADFRQSLIDALSDSGITIDESHGFTPHITLAYIPSGAPTPPDMPTVTDLTFDTVIVAFGDHQVLFPLGDPAADEAALEDAQDGGADDSAEQPDGTLMKSVGDDTLIAYGGAIKSLPNGHVGGYLVRFSGPNDPDLTGDFFTPDTDFGFEPGETLKTAVYFNHRLPLKTRDGRELTIKQKIGSGTLSMDETGVFIDAVLYNRERYESTLSKQGWSSGTASHLVDREPVGKSMWVKSWQLGLDASITPTPAEPRTSVLSLKSFLADMQTPQARSQAARTAATSSATVDADAAPNNVFIIVKR